MCNGGAISSGLKAVSDISNSVMANATAKGNAKTIQSVSKVQSKRLKNKGNVTHQVPWLRRLKMAWM